MLAANYYEILGIPTDATAKQIRQARRRLAVKYHPDKNVGNKKAESLMQEANAAADVLEDPEARRKYDATLETSSTNQPGKPVAPDYYDILGVERDATVDEITEGHRLSILNKDADDIALIDLAFETLVDPSGRKHYDEDQGYNVKGLSWGSTIVEGPEWMKTLQCREIRRPYLAGVKTGIWSNRIIGDTPYPTNLRGWLILGKYARTPAIFKQTDGATHKDFEQQFSEWAEKARTAIRWAREQDAKKFAVFITKMEEAIELIEGFALKLDLVALGRKNFEKSIFEDLGKIYLNMPLEVEASFLDLYEANRNHDSVSKLLTWALKNLPVDDPVMVRSFPLIAYVKTAEMKQAQLDIVNGGRTERLVLAHLQRHVNAEYVCGSISSRHYSGSGQTTELYFPTNAFQLFHRGHSWVEHWNTRHSAIKNALNALSGGMIPDRIKSTAEDLKKLTIAESDVMLASPGISKEQLEALKTGCKSLEICDRFRTVESK